MHSSTADKDMGERRLNGDVESPASIDTSTSPAPRLPPSVGEQRPSKWLSFENKKHNTLFRTFLLEQSSRTTIFVIVLLLTVIFGIYLLRLFTSKTATSVGPILVLSRVLRFLSCAFGWAHLYFLKDKASADDSSKKMALLSADQFILWSSIMGTVVLLLRCIEGACEEGQNEDSCNPRHEEHGLPIDTLVGNLFIITLLPVLCKAHSTSILLMSYCVTFLGLIVASLFAANPPEGFFFHFCGILFFTMMVYDHERNMMTVFLVIQGQQTYYNELLSLERIRVSAEMETVELRNLIGNIAHDLKTPLQAVMVEMDGLQVGLDVDVDVDVNLLNVLE